MAVLVFIILCITVYICIIPLGPEITICLEIAISTTLLFWQQRRLFELRYGSINELRKRRYREKEEELKKEKLKTENYKEETVEELTEKNKDIE
ncbi:MAG: hypothetical protein Q4E50_01200 [Tissierellia bacterium]|nr:hypothetical protein [Tissierellia bacterium]